MLGGGIRQGFLGTAQHSGGGPGLNNSREKVCIPAEVTNPGRVLHDSSMFRGLREQPQVFPIHADLGSQRPTTVKLRVHSWRRALAGSPGSVPGGFRIS